jgi:hypothetical protein
MRIWIFLRRSARRGDRDNSKCLFDRLFGRNWAGERACGALAFANTFNFFDTETHGALSNAFLELAKGADLGLLRCTVIDYATRLCGAGVDAIVAVRHFAADSSPMTTCRLPAFLDAYLGSGGRSRRGTAQDPELACPL